MSVGNPRDLRENQYKDSTNLRARGTLHERFSTNPYGWFRWVHDHLDVPRHGRVLELGCGSGALWVGYQPQVPDSCRIVLSDLSRGMVCEARERLAGQSRFTFAVLDAQAIPYAAGVFDAVIANHMLYHVPDLRRTLSEIRRVLRPAGRLYAATNGRSHLKEIADLIEAFDPALVSSWAGDRRTFDLDDGAEHLARWFTEIRMYRYEDSLLVDEAEPLAAYVYSMPMAVTQRVRRDAFVRFVERRLAERGPLRITKDVGLFVAVRA